MPLCWERASLNHSKKRTPTQPFFSVYTVVDGLSENTTSRNWSIPFPYRRWKWRRGKGGKAATLVITDNTHPAVLKHGWRWGGGDEHFALPEASYLHSALCVFWCLLPERADCQPGAGGISNPAAVQAASKGIMLQLLLSGKTWKGLNCLRLEKISHMEGTHNLPTLKTSYIWLKELAQENMGKLSKASPPLPVVLLARLESSILGLEPEVLGFWPAEHMEFRSWVVQLQSSLVFHLDFVSSALIGHFPMVCLFVFYFFELNVLPGIHYSFQTHRTRKSSSLNAHFTKTSAGWGFCRVIPS